MATGSFVIKIPHSKYTAVTVLYGSVRARRHVKSVYYIYHTVSQSLSVSDSVTLNFAAVCFRE